MKRHTLLALVAVLAVALAGPTAAGQSLEPKVKVLATPVGVAVNGGGPVEILWINCA